MLAAHDHEAEAGRKRHRQIVSQNTQCVSRPTTAMLRVHDPGCAIKGQAISGCEPTHPSLLHIVLEQQRHALRAVPQEADGSIIATERDGGKITQRCAQQLRGRRVGEEHKFTRRVLATQEGWAAPAQGTARSAECDAPDACAIADTPDTDYVAAVAAGGATVGAAPRRVDPRRYKWQQARRGDKVGPLGLPALLWERRKGAPVLLDGACIWAGAWSLSERHDRSVAEPESQGVREVHSKSVARIGRRTVHPQNQQVAAQREASCRRSILSEYAERRHSTRVVGCTGERVAYKAEVHLVVRFEQTAFPCRRRVLRASCNPPLGAAA